MKRSRRFAATLALIAAFVVLGAWLAWGNATLTVTELSIASAALPDAFDGYRIAHISDLHNAEFGQGNERLLAALEGTRPDVIVITGDIIDSRHTDIPAALRFAQGAAAIAPTYYVTGNHEARIAAYPELEAGLALCGVNVLHDEALSLERGGGSIRLIGMDDPYFCDSGDRLYDDAATSARLNGLIGEENGYTILLSHRPELFALYAQSGAELAFCGHAHGGQFRLPFIGGVFAPDQGFFPQYDSGPYREGDFTMVVSRGLGNSLFPFRLNNRPEIVLAELSPE